MTPTIWTPVVYLCHAILISNNDQTIRYNLVSDLFTIAARNDLISFIAKCWPMQFLKERKNNSHTTVPPKHIFTVAICFQFNTYRKKHVYMYNTSSKRSNRLPLSRRERKEGKRVSPYAVFGPKAVGIEYLKHVNTYTALHFKRNTNISKMEKDISVKISTFYFANVCTIFYIK